MAYDQELDDKVRTSVKRYGMLRKSMFGGTCYLEKEKMVCGIWKDNLILRLGEEQGVRALQNKKVRVFDITGKPMKGWVMINKKHLSPKTINEWIQKARDHVKTLKGKK